MYYFLKLFFPCYSRYMLSCSRSTIFAYIKRCMFNKYILLLCICKVFSLHTFINGSSPPQSYDSFWGFLYNYWTFCRYIIWYIGMDKEYKDLGQYYHMYPWYFCTLNTNAHFFMYNFYWIILLLTRRREMSMYDMFGLSHMATVSSN